MSSCGSSLAYAFSPFRQIAARLLLKSRSSSKNKTNIKKMKPLKAARTNKSLETFSDLDP